MRESPDFKQVNDTFGHTIGDTVLSHLAATIRDALRVEDLFARYGGEEFVIIARGIDVSHAMLLAERIRKIVASSPFVQDAIVIPLTISVGVASLAECRETSSEQLIGQADKRLYQAKADGRTCCRGA